MDDSRKDAIACSIACCPNGCSVLTIGAVSIHVSRADFVNLTNMMVHHARSQGLELPAEPAAAAAVQYN